MIEYQDFLCYALENDGTHTELDIQEDSIEENLNPDNVLIFIKQDLRRLWIWKGPKAPVRKRFISSRVAAKIQEEIRRESGRHLKIISVDAGDEPVEFLSTFNLESMEITEKMRDMVYIRNVERDRIKEEQIKKSVQESQSEESYWSPLLEESSVPSTIHSGAFSSTTSDTDSPKPLTDLRNIILKEPEQTEKQDFEMIHKILETDPPNGLTRVNIIIGQRLYAPMKTSSEVFGEIIETETWDVVSKLPKDMIDFSTKQIRVYTDKKSGKILATVIYKKITDANPTSTKKKSDLISKDITPTKRDLPKIPSADE